MENGVKQIQINNFQSIKQLNMQLGDLTVITGRSDCGKSALFRAVKAAVSNQSGDAYITQGEKRTVVQIDDVKWIQSKTENAYEIGDRKWQKCGRGVPDEVSAELNMGETEFSKDVKAFLNFSGQLEQAFIVQGNPADNAKIIGSISNVHVVYNGLREAEKDTKNIKRKMTVIQEQLDESTVQLVEDERKFRRLEKFYVRLKEIYTRATEIDIALQKLAVIHDDYIRVVTEIGKAIEIAKRYEGIDLSGIDSKARTLDAAQRFKRQINDLDALIRSAEAQNRVLRAFKPDEGLMTLRKYERLLEAQNERQSLIDGLNGVKSDKVAIDARIEGFESAIGEFGICDVCGSPRSAWNI